MSAVHDHGRSRLALGVALLVSLLIAAIAAGTLAPGAHAGYSKCPDEYGNMKVKKISCKDAQKQVTSKIVNSWFTGKGVDWGRGCGRGKAAKTCHFKVSGFKCTGVDNRKKYIFAINCAKDKQRVKAKLNTAVG